MPARREVRLSRGAARNNTRNITRAATVVVGVAALVAGALGGPAAHAAATTAAGSAASAGATTSRVVLPTGDTVLVHRTGTGRSTYATVAAAPSGVTGSFSSVAVGGDEYVLPGEAKPLLGSLIDPSLFDVTTLAAATARPTLTATVTSGAARVPGLTVTGRTATTVTGYVGAAGAAAFRTALVDAATSVSSGRAQTAFPGVTRLSSSASTVVTPAYPQVVLNVAVTGPAGQRPPSGFVILLNTDDARRYSSFVFVDHGHAKVSVPLGHYSGIANVAQISSTGFSSVDIPVADYTVTGDQQTLTFDTTTATVTAGVTLPDASAELVDTDINWTRIDAHGTSSSSFSDNVFGGGQLRWAPTPPVQVGQEDWSTGFHATGGTTGAPTTYDLSYATEGFVPSDGQHTVGPADLATIDASYYLDRRGHSEFGLGAVHPFDFFIFTNLYDLITPARVTEYVNDDDVAWSASLIGTTGGSDGFGGDVVFEAGAHTYAAGTTTQVDWLRGPLAPAPYEDAPGTAAPFCSVCRTAHALSISLAPFVDTEPGHDGLVSSLPPDGSPAVHTRLSVDGHRIAGGANTLGLQARVSADPRRYDLVVRTDRSGEGDSLSSSTLTDYGFTSSATTGQPAPASGYCPVSRDATDCRTLGLLRITAPLPTDLYRRVPVGSSTFTMTVAPYDDPSQRITSAGVGVSLADKFIPATLTRVGPQQFAVTLPSPASWAGQPVTLRVSATDAAGDTITQTTTAAYAVAGS